MRSPERMRQDAHAIWAAWLGFAAGSVLGAGLLWGVARPLAGEGSIGMPAAAVTAAVAVAAFAAGTRMHRAADTAGMPPWQAAVSRISDAAVALALGGVCGLAVLCAGEVLAIGLHGLDVPPLGGGLLTGVASAAAAGSAFGLGARLRTDDLVTLLFAFLITGTLFAMLTATDPRWWERNFSQLGIGDGGWAFNGTLVVGGLLLATVGAYVGRDLHRILGDAALFRIGVVVVLFAATGAALAAVGLLPVHRGPVAHFVAAFAALALLGAAAVVTVLVMPGPPPMLTLTTIGVAAGLVLAVLLWRPLAIYSATALEAVAVGLGFVWLTTLMRTLAALAPDEPRPSARPRLRAGR
ncbi:DUF998 domain-containing protein [Microbacterium sp. MEC084]|uniref:DUF998 domain-containing protein n=1 Tax=Microbacterium sp. MEC084 TaxID=1963027 RepID=UPI001E314F12|nr:DUF998 domain-containing protein [Microbacterium sp. MEC084]